MVKKEVNKMVKRGSKKDDFKYIETDYDDPHIMAKHGNHKAHFEKYSHASYDGSITSSREYLHIEHMITDAGGRLHPHFSTFLIDGDRMECVDSLIQVLKMVKKQKAGCNYISNLSILHPLQIEFSFSLGPRKSWKKEVFSSSNDKQRFYFDLLYIHVDITIPWRSIYHYFKGNLVKSSKGWVMKPQGDK